MLIKSSYPVITITGPHGSGKDTLIASALGIVKNAQKVVSSTNRLPRNGEIEGYSYEYNGDIPKKNEIYDGITLPSINSRTGDLGVTYWITKNKVNKLFEENQDVIHLWHTAPTVIQKLKDEFSEKVYSIYLHADPDILISRLQSRDGMTFDQAISRLSHDPGNIEADLNKLFDRKLFDATISTNKPKDLVLDEFISLIR